MISSYLQASILKSFEGLVGCRFPDSKVYITSPNMDTMYPPLLGTQHICMRRQLHFGEHDPCLAPQLFDERTPHLTCIPFPGSTDNNILWMLPSENDFEPIEGHKLAKDPIGHLPQHLLDHLNDEYTRILLGLGAGARDSSSLKTSVSAANDPKVKEYRSRIRYLLSHLQSPSKFGEALMVWHIVQCNCLELDARITWIQSIALKFRAPSVWKVPLPLKVVGAITADLKIAEYCFWVFFSITI